MDIKEKILEQIEIRNTAGLSMLLSQNLSSQARLNSMDLENSVTEFKVQHFLRGLSPLVSELKTKEAMNAIVTIISITLEHWEYELSPQECFVLYHMKEFGRFRIKDEKYFTQLKKLYSTHKDYEVDFNELKQILKDFKNIKFIDYRRGTIIFNSSVVLR